MLVVHIWWWFLNCLQILQEVFLKLILSKYQLIVSEDATGVQRWDTLRKDQSQGILICWAVVPMFVNILSWKVLNRSIWIQKKYTRRDYHSFVWYPPKMLFLLPARYCRKKVIFVFCLCLSLFPSLSRTPLCISIITVSFWEDVVFTRHLPHI